LGRGALELDVEGLDFALDLSALLVDNDGLLYFARAGRNQLYAFLGKEQRHLLICQAGMLAVFAFLAVVPPDLDDAVTVQQAVMGCVPQDAITGVVAPENEIGVVSCLLAELLVAGALGLVDAHAVR